MVKIAITGGIGTGKSSLCRFFEDWGFPVISADKEAHKALMAESPVYPSLLKLFNKKSTDSLNPKEIAKDIFSNLSLKKKFEDIMHPYIFESILQEEKKIKNHSHTFYEIPLLFETNLMDYFNWIILVTCSKNLQKQRIIAKMHLSPAETQMRIDAQNPQETKTESSDIVIKNNGSLNDLKQKAEDILGKLALTKKDSSC